MIELGAFVCLLMFSSMPDKCFMCTKHSKSCSKHCIMEICWTMKIIVTFRRPWRARHVHRCNFDGQLANSYAIVVNVDSEHCSLC